MAAIWVRCFVLLSVFFAVLLAGLLLKTLSIRKLESKLKPCRADDSDFIPLEDAVVDRFRTGLKMQTISYSEHNYNRDELDLLVRFIIAGYPTLHSSSRVTWERVANFSLLYHIHGTNPSLRPYLLMAHLDVVPADAKDWEMPPFGAEIHDGYIYARGAIDDKHAVFGILEAVEFALKHRHPERSFYVAFGHDEEVHGYDGAFAIAKKLHASGVELEFLLDEGLTVVKGVLSFIEKPVALIGVSEKGYLTLRLSATVPGGHSSMPGRESSIGILANAISRLEANPIPSMLGTGPETGMFEDVAPETSFPIRVVLSNIWFFGPLLSRFLSRIPTTNALIRTTTAVTMFNAGVKENVLASQAEAVINHRIHPCQSVKEVLEFDQQIINDDRVQLEVIAAEEPHPISNYGPDSFGYETIRSSILQIFGQSDVIVLPGLMVGKTDTGHYLNLTRNVYRFSPSFLEKDDMRRFHGLNERMSLKNFEQVINFYYHVIVNSDAETVGHSSHDKSAHDDF